MAEQRRNRWSLLAVQSTVCGVILLLVLVLRLIGGDTWNTVRTVAQRWMTDAGIAQQWAETPSDETVGVGGRDIVLGQAVSVWIPPDGVTFSSLPIPAQQAFPLKTGRVTSRFGYRTDPADGGTSFHTGMDIAAPEGTPLCAMIDGTVTKATWDDSYGYYIDICDSDGLTIRYAHCRMLLLGVGETVCAGETVALVGNTGNSFGSHVHLMALRDNIAYDPAPLIAGAGYA